MSIKLMSAVFESDLAPTERLVMLALADHADDAGRCYPSIQRLCARTGLTERPVQKCIRALQAAGHLRIEEGGGKHRPNVYHVTTNPVAKTPFQKPRSRNPVSETANPVPKTPEPSRTVSMVVVEAREAQTDREAILAAIGVDPVSGLTGHGGRMIGTQADMAEAARWLELPGLSVPVICEEIRRIMAGKRDGPPKSFRYFTEAMQRLSGQISAPPINPIAPAAGGKHSERRAFDKAIAGTAAALSDGTATLDYSSRDPFAVKPRRDPDPDQYRVVPIFRP